MQTTIETATRAGSNVDETTALKVKKLILKRDTVRNLNDEILTSQGHSLWTCDGTGGPAAEK